MSEKKLLSKMFTFCMVFSMTAMTAMSLFFIRREKPANAGELAAGTEMESMMEADSSLFTEAEQVERKGYICIPLPEECTEDKIQITGDPAGHRVMVTIQNVSEDFFYRHPLTGNSERIEQLMYGYADGTARMDFELTGFYEYEKIITLDRLYLKFLPPKELYSRIVVLDAGHGGADAGTVVYQVNEKDVTLNVALKVGALLEEAGIHVYYTRAEDHEVSPEERTRIVSESQADMLVSIHCNADSRTRVTTGMEFLYTNAVTDRRLSNEDLSDCLSDGLETSIEDTTFCRKSGAGIFLLDQSEVPSVMIQTGYLTNKQEALHLTDQNYLDQVADGIYNGITKAYEEMEK